ncbi:MULTISPECIES: hypothetical protein [Clostridia]|nr:MULTISPECIES: hypothetical protein [Clostridia]
MDHNERESIIAQLALAEGVNESVFQKYTDEQLLQEMKSLFGDDE